MKQLDKRSQSVQHNIRHFMLPGTQAENRLAT